MERVTRHGTNACYQRGCRQPECAVAHNIAHNRWRGHQIKKGPKRVPVEPTMRAVRYAMAAGIPWSKITDMAGSPGRSAANIETAAWLNRDTRDRLHAAMRECLAELAEALADAESALAFASDDEKVARTFDPGPLRERLHGRMKGLLGEADRRYLYQGRRLAEERVRRICQAARIDPEDVYPDWYALEVVA